MPTTHTSSTSHRNRIATLAVVVCLGCILIAPITVGSGLGVTTTGPPVASAQTDQKPMHTLVIRSDGSSGKYLLTATGTTSIRKTEASDVHQPPVVQGSVGKNDGKDVIRYTGHITSFKHQGNLQVTLNGRSAPPEVLNGNYLNVSTSKHTKSRYRMVASGTIIAGEEAEGNDLAPKNDSRVEGHVSKQDRQDSFYYTGEFVSGAASTKLSLAANGQPISMYKRGSTPTDSPNGPNSPPSTAKQTATEPGTTAREQSTSPSIHPSQTAESGSKGTDRPDGGGGLSLLELVGGIIGMLVVAVLGLLFLSQ
ncbi:hypothetical protein ACFQL7_27615 [Halocatena marina]|uniref:Uncharacterized protein n=1 Tax=Halocatena marina TaxID=2934937 RepID=A0ABD5YZ41_9EURY